MVFSKKIKNKTLNYYNLNASEFVNQTAYVEFSDTQNIFLNKLAPISKILDFGCGSGRDSKYFIEKGHKVEATDGSMELCQIASVFTGIEVRHMLFQDLESKEQYDGIWACASILHLPKKELLIVLEKMAEALKIRGVIYTSFKYGEFEGERNNRYFTDFTIETFNKFIDAVPMLDVEEYWITSDVRPNRGEEKWLNLILRKI